MEEAPAALMVLDTCKSPEAALEAPEEASESSEEAPETPPLPFDPVVFVPALEVASGAVLNSE